MMAPILRPMHLQDAPILAQLDGQDNSLAWTQTMFESELTLKHSRSLVVEKDGQLCAFVIGWIVADSLQILELAVDRAKRRQGFAQMLLTTFLQQAKQDFCLYAELELRCDNIPALTLYKKLGFKIVGNRPNFYQDKNGKKTDAFLMKLSL